MSIKKTLITISTVIVAGGVATYVYLKWAPGDVLTAIGGARIVPDRALMSGFISTDPSAWSKLQQFGTDPAQKLITEQIKKVQQDLASKIQVDFDKDIQPWVGGVTMAILPSKSPQDQTQNVLMVIGIKDKLNAWNFGMKLKNVQKNVKVVESQYKGVTITQQDQQNYALLNNSYLVISSDQETLQLAIDTFQGTTASLASKSDAMMTKDVNVKNSIAMVFMPDYGALVEHWISQAKNDSKLSALNMNQLKSVKSVVMNLGVEEQGLRLQAIAKVDPAGFKTVYKQPNPGKLLGLFPSQTFALISGSGINQIWSNLQIQSQENPDLKQQVNKIKEGLKLVNLDADKDVFNWMNGEFALGTIGTDQGMLKALGFGGSLVLETSDRPTATATLQKLDNFVKNNPISSVTIEPRDIQGVTVTEWKIPLQGAILGYGWLNQNSVFLAFGGPIVDLMAPKPSNPLNVSDNFKTIAGFLPNPNLGYFYVDMDQAMSILGRQFQVSPDLSAVLNSIRGIGLTANWPDEATGKLELGLALKPHQQK